MPKSSASVKVSILIPAYNHAAGVARVLETVIDRNNGLEVIVFDDSTSAEVRHTVAAYKNAFESLIYQNNQETLGKTLGAPDNWNALLDAASGEFVMLMHHDEYPLSTSFYDEMSEAIANNPSADVFLLGLRLVDRYASPLRMHAPYWLRYLTSSRFPGYLFRRNVIGPTGTLVIRREIVPRFSANLKWLVDVEFYFKLFSSDIDVVACPHAIIGSVQGEHQSITEMLGADIDEIERRELRDLALSFGGRSIWLLPTLGWVARALELTPWTIWRCISKVHFHIATAVGQRRQ